MPISLRKTMDSTPIGSLQWLVAVMLTGVIVLDGLDLQLAAFSAPMLMANWHLSKAQFAPVLAAAMIGMAIGALVGSWISDRYGRKPTLVGSVAFFGIMTLICASAIGPKTFAFWRLLSGCGFGAAFPVATAMMSEWLPRRAVGKAISVMTLGFPMGAIGGALAASWLLPRFGWHGCFASSGGLCLLFAAILLWKLPESPSYLIFKGRHEAAHTLLARAWHRPVMDGVQNFEREVRQEDTGGLFARDNLRVNLGLWMAVLCNSLATYVIASWLTVILVGFHIPLATALRGSVVFSLSAIVGALASGWSVVRLGSRPVLLTLSLASLVAAMGMSTAAYMLARGTPLFAALFSGLAVEGFAMGGLQAGLYVLAATAYETHIRSRGIGVASLVGRLGTILSSFVGAAVLTLAHEEGFFALVGILGAAVAVGMLIVNRHVIRMGNAHGSLQGGFAVGKVPARDAQPAK